MICESRLPHKFRHLAKDYWDIRNKIIQQDRGYEPYICMQISLAIKEYLEKRGYKVDYVKDSRKYHFYLSVDDEYIIDGSDYQYDYDKSILRYLPNRIATILKDTNLITIGSALALVDFAAGSPLVSGMYGPNLNPDDHKRALSSLRPSDIEFIKGRLLPIVLKILPKALWKSNYIIAPTRPSY